MSEELRKRRNTETGKQASLEITHGNCAGLQALEAYGTDYSLQRVRGAEGPELSTDRNEAAAFGFFGGGEYCNVIIVREG